jgi:hypothetical protein
MGSHKPHPLLPGKRIARGSRTTSTLRYTKTSLELKIAQST